LLPRQATACSDNPASHSCQIFCRDAVKVLQNTDRPNAFHFIDPPYINTDCGHYGGYTEKDFIDLLNQCEQIKGKFLLTSFDSDILQKYVNRNGWKQIRKEMHKASSKKAGVIKVEVMTMNY
jgi:DNA adenine methylase